MHAQLEEYASSLYNEPDLPVPKGRFGTCSVVGNVVTVERGSIVAELGCGVRLVRTGIVDDLGLEIGATGQDVLDRKLRPTEPLRCFPNGAAQTRCMFERAPDGDTDGTAYVVDGATSEPVRGAAAVTYFASRTIVEIHVSAWCH